MVFCGTLFFKQKEGGTVIQATTNTVWHRVCLSLLLSQRGNAPTLVEVKWWKVPLSQRESFYTSLQYLGFDWLWDGSKDFVKCFCSFNENNSLQMFYLLPWWVTVPWHWPLGLDSIVHHLLGEENQILRFQHFYFLVHARTEQSPLDPTKTVTLRSGCSADNNSSTLGSAM